ncbi:MAG TPA: low temperature requirement protein A [Thermoleophilaceae bacterium]|nr:low temperature requirement protein A [Thermoleophilaceae bacterium]
MEASANTPEATRDESERKVTPLELFFDLVFVFGLTQVTLLMSKDPTWSGLGKGLLVFSALWWAWAAYAWLTNTFDSDDGIPRIVMFAVMAAFLLAALATPGAFDDDGVLFGCAYVAARLLHIVLFAITNDDVDGLEAIKRLARTAIPAPALLIVAGFLDGPEQYIFWVAALTIDFLGPYVFGVRGFTVSAGHFAERFSLVLIIALGESIVAVGAGAVDVELGAGVVTAAVLGIVVSAALWWAYFDVVAIVAERKFRETTGHERVLIARDSYSYLHLPMIFGIVLVALGVKKTIGHYDDPLKLVPAAALLGGVALYYLGHVGFRLRNVHSLNKQRLAAALISVALIPLATEIPALGALALAAAVTSGLIAYEAIRFAEDRRRVREAAAAH